MLYRGLDNNGDYILGQGTQSFLTDAQAVAQAIQTNLLLLQGEWWESTNLGLPLFQNILGQIGTPDKLKSVDLLIQSQILSTLNVISISNFSGTYLNRQYSIVCSVNTKFGVVNIQLPLNIPL